MWDVVPGFDFNKEVDIPELHSWFLAGQHSFPRFTPMFSWFWIRYCGYGSQYGAEMMSLPRSKGFTLREFEGGCYIGNRIIRDEAVDVTKVQNVQFRSQRLNCLVRTW
jgi:hypothetical protein